MVLQQKDVLTLKDRFGEEALSKRLRQQIKISSALFGAGRALFHLEAMWIVPKILKTILRVTRQLDRGLDNALNFQIEEVSTSFHDLPEAFHGYRILHLSDLHLDGMIDGGYGLNQQLQNLQYDLCVMTGDFRYLTVHGYDETLKRMTILMENINCPDGCYGVLGNHDFIEEVPGLELIGLRMLLNESTRITRGDDSIYLAGIDDPHFYGTDDIKKAAAEIPSEYFSILLSHSPEAVMEAATEEFNLYLCGHTHSGQICLPGGIPILTNSAGSRRFSRGQWRQDKMQGYTSRGTGASTLPVRFFCPPEITLHTLKRQD